MLKQVQHDVIGFDLIFNPFPGTHTGLADLKWQGINVEVSIDAETSCSA